MIVPAWKLALGMYAFNLRSTELRTCVPAPQNCQLPFLSHYWFLITLLYTAKAIVACTYTLLTSKAITKALSTPAVCIGGLATGAIPTAVANLLC